MCAITTNRSISMSAPRSPRGWSGMARPPIVRCVEAMRRPRGSRGHGNAIAQSYNHSILPLLSARDRELQIAWGIEDFVYRFGHQPEGIWLPECALDDDTLESVANAGLKFTILAGDQGRFEGEAGKGRGAGPFIWRRGDLSLAIFVSIARSRRRFLLATR